MRVTRTRRGSRRWAFPPATCVSAGCITASSRSPTSWMMASPPTTLPERPSAGHSTAELDRPGEDCVEHRLRQPSGERVLLARVERAQQVKTVGGARLDGVAELGTGAHTELGARRVVGKRAEAHHHTESGQQFEFAFEKPVAGDALGR